MSGAKSARTTRRGGKGGGRPSGNGGRAPGRGARTPGTATRAATDTTGDAETPAVPPRWIRLTTLVLAVAGLGVSIYLTIAHYSGSVSLACPETGTINCEKVTTSPESVILGLPVALLGLLYFIFMVAVTTPQAWRVQRDVVRISRLLAAVIGIVFVLYLVYVELFKVNAICLWCTSVHVLTFALFVLVLSASAGQLHSRR